MLTANEALQRLKDGNQRFVAELGGSGETSSQRRRDLATGQEPFAIILGCSDSRVPAEIIFDQGLGDLFVIRVAGNIVAPSQVDSIEFSAARHGNRLVVVLGRSEAAGADRDDSALLPNMSRVKGSLLMKFSSGNGERQRPAGKHAGLKYARVQGLVA